MKKKIIISACVMIAALTCISACGLWKQKGGDIIKYDVYEISMNQVQYSPSTQTGYAELSIYNDQGGFTKLFLTHEDQKKDGGNLVDDGQYELHMYSGKTELDGMTYQSQYKSHRQTLAVDFISPEQDVENIKFVVKDVESGSEVLELYAEPQIDETNVCMTNDSADGTITVSATGVRADSLDYQNWDSEQGISGAEIQYADGTRTPFLELWKTDLPMHKKYEEKSGTGAYAIALENPENIVRISTNMNEFHVEGIKEKAGMHELPASDDLRFIEDIHANFYQYELGQSREELVKYLQDNHMEYMEIPSSNGDSVYRLTDQSGLLLRCNDNEGLYEITGNSVADGSVTYDVSKEEAITNLEDVYDETGQTWEANNLEIYEFHYKDSYLTYSFLGENIFSVVRSRDGYGMNNTL